MDTQIQIDVYKNENVENDQITLLNSVLQISIKNHSDTTIMISNSFIKDINVFIGIATIIFFNCTFHNVQIMDNFLTHAGQLDITLNRCEFNCKSYNIYRICGIQLHIFDNSGFVQLSIIDTAMDFCSLDIKANSILLSFVDSFLFNTLVKISSSSFIKVPSIIIIHKTNFTNNRSTTYDEPFSLKLLNPYIIINSSTFRANPVEIIPTTEKRKPAFYYVQIMDSYFGNAQKDGNGGALLILSNMDGAICKIANVTFWDNKAHFGKGGAIYAEGNSLLFIIDKCNFLLNQADDIGSSVCASQGVTLDIYNTIFLSEIKTQILFPVLSILGRVKKISAEFGIENMSPFVYNSPFNVFTIETVSDYLSIDVSCPLWYTHNYDYRIEAFSNIIMLKNRSFQSIGNLKYECGVCPDGYYIIIPRKISISYFTNVSSSKESARSTCQLCPYGAHCSGNNVVARPNFWGYFKADYLLFQQCPKHYCCSGSKGIPCKTHNTCAKYRTGILCGKCENGFSISMLTSDCIPNSQCGRDQWFWLIAFMTMLSYTVWYTFKIDIMHILFLGMNRLKNVCHSKLLELCSNNLEVLSSSEVLPSDHVAEKRSVQSNEEDKGYFGIVIYFVQMAALMKIEIEFSDINQGRSILSQIMKYVEMLFTFELSQLSFRVCPIEGLTTLGKHLYKLLFLLGIYLIWLGITFFNFVLLRVVRQHGRVYKLCQKIQLKLVEGLLEIIKYTYSGFCDIIFTSLVCIEIGIQSVWFYDGSNVCYEYWQVSMIVFGIFYAIPFPFVLIRAMKLLERDHISSGAFILSLIFPLISLLVISLLELLKPDMINQCDTSKHSKVSETIIYNL